jgi:hypothetical protein
MTKRPKPTGAGKSASLAEARNLGVFMPAYAWDLSGTDNRCHSYRPGHLIHWMQFKLSMTKPSPVIPVTAGVDDDGMVYIEGDDVSVVGWNHRPTLIQDALHRFDGMALWKPSFHLLAVPTDSFWGSARTVFSIAALEEKRECEVTRVAHPDHRVTRASVPTNLPPVRIAARYAAGRPRPPQRRR